MKAPAGTIDLPRGAMQFVFRPRRPREPRVFWVVPQATAPDRRPVPGCECKHFLSVVVESLPADYWAGLSKLMPPGTVPTVCSCVGGIIE